MKRREEDLYTISIPPKKQAEKKDMYKTALSSQPWLMNPQSKEQVVCLKCETSVYIYRHRARTQKVNTLSISSRFSTYMPQKLQQCLCGELEVLVDHKGRTRIYTDDSAHVQIRFPLKGFAVAYATQSLALCKTINDWVDTPYDYRAKPLKVDASFDKANHLNLWPIREKEQRRFLPHPTDSARLNFLKDYAYTFQIALCVTVSTQRVIIFPDGAVIQPKGITEASDFLRAKATVQERNQSILKVYEEEYRPLQKAFRNNYPPLQFKEYPDCLTAFLQYRKFADVYRDSEGRPRADHMLKHFLQTLIKYRDDLLVLPPEGWFLRAQQINRHLLRQPKVLPKLLQYYIDNPHKIEPYDKLQGARIPL